MSALMLPKTAQLVMASPMAQVTTLGHIDNTIESLEELAALEAARNNPKAVPMPQHVRAKIEQILNLPPVYKPEHQPEAPPALESKHAE